MSYSYRIIQFTLRMTVYTIDTLENHIATEKRINERKWKRAMPFYHPLLLQCPLFVYILDEFLLSSTNGSRVSFRSRSTVQNLLWVVPKN